MWSQDAAPLDLDIEEVKGRLTEWIAQEQVAAEIKRRFRHFLRNFPNNNPQQAGQPEGARQQEVYMYRIHAMCKGGWGGMQAWVVEGWVGRGAGWCKGW